MYTLIHGDCLKELKKIPDNTVNLVLVDPPYGVTKCEWDKPLPIEDLWKEYERVCKGNAQIVMFGVEPYASSVRVSNLKRYRYDWIWRKTNGTGYLLSRKMPLNDYECIMVFFASDIIFDTTKLFQKSKDYLIGEKEKAVRAGFIMDRIFPNNMAHHYFSRKKQFQFPSRKAYEKLQNTTGFFQRDYEEVREEYESEKRITYNPQFSKGDPYEKSYISDIEIYGVKREPSSSKGKRYPKRVLEYTYETGFHPTQKPVPLLEYLIKTYTNPCDTVLDNCMGTGSAGVACLNCDRNFIGIELDKGYYEVAEQRMKERITELNSV